MKTMRLLLALVSLAVLAVRLPAQAIQNVIVTRVYSVNQTDAIHTTGASATPFSFQVATEGDGSATDTSPITAASVTLPGPGASYGLNPPSIAGNGKWRYNSPGYIDAATLNSNYGAGAYDVNLTGSGYGHVSISVGDITTSDLSIPILGLSSVGGSWTANPGTFTFVVGQDINITFNPISGGNDAHTYHYDFNANGTNTLHDAEHEPNDFVAAGESPSNFMISTSSFIAGQSYTIEVGYDDIQSFDGDAYSMGITAAGLYEIRSTITLTAVPEPSTYAAIFGAVALAGVMLHRRRRQMA